MSGFNPLVAQGLLNRVRTHVVVPAYPSLNATASYMGKSMAVLTFEGPAVQQPETGTGIVNSPQPFVMGTLVVSLLRSQALLGVWFAQWQNASILGNVDTYADTSMLDGITLLNCSITDIDLGAFDGADPTAKVTVKGVFPVNSVMWAQASS